MSALSSSPSTFAFFVDKYYQWLLRFAQRKVANHAQAEDLLHDALLDAHVGLKQCRGDATLPAWVTGVLRNKIHRHYRSQAHSPIMVQEDSPFYEEPIAAGSDPSEMLSVAQRIDCLCRLIEALPDPIRVALCGVALDGEAYALVASHLNIPIGTLRSQLSRVREQMRKGLEAEGVGRTD